MSRENLIFKKFIQEHQYQLDLNRRGMKSGKDSVMGRHELEKHSSDRSSVRWSMRVLSCHPCQPHVRQCMESVWIGEIGQGMNLINGRAERSSDLITGSSSNITRSRPTHPPAQ